MEIRSTHRREFKCEVFLFTRRQLRQRRRRITGHCLECGYDLRATPFLTGEKLPRCPECGAIPSPSREKGRAKGQ